MVTFYTRPVAENLKVVFMDKSYKSEYNVSREISGFIFGKTRITCKVKP